MNAYTSLEVQEAFRTDANSQDKSSTRSSLDVVHDVSPHARVVFVNVTGSHVTFIAF